MKYLRKLLEFTDENFQSMAWWLLIVMTIIYIAAMFLVRSLVV